MQPPAPPAAAFLGELAAASPRQPASAGPSGPSGPSGPCLVHDIQGLYAKSVWRSVIAAESIGLWKDAASFLLARRSR